MIRTRVSGMKLKVVRSQNSVLSGHVLVYAWSESDEDFYYISSGEKIRGLKLDFPAFYPRLPLSQIHEDNINQDEDNNSIILDSHVSFEFFYTKLMNSKFNMKNVFNEKSNNCVHAVIYALKSAKIKLDLDENIKMKHLFCCFWCPVNIITPKELMTALAVYKKQSLLMAYKKNI